MRVFVLCCILLSQLGLELLVDAVDYAGCLVQLGWEGDYEPLVLGFWLALGVGPSGVGLS